MVYKIDSNDLTIMFKKHANSLVGKVLKRIEIITDREVLKDNVKELLHEEMRTLLSTLEAYHNGSIFTLQQKDSPNKG